MRVRASKRGQRGLSLIEVTIMLLVLMLLTSVLAPSIFDFVEDAQWVKVKEDCEAITISVARLIKDVGPNLVFQNGSFPANKMDLMVSEGNPPTLGTGFTADVPGQPDRIKNWYATNGTNTSLTNHGNGLCDEQLITNYDGSSQIYNEPTSLTIQGPYFGQGWRGAYMSPPCAGDPWGHTYQVNTKWLTRSFYSQITGAGTTFHCGDVFCISAGKDGVITTPFGFDPTTYPQSTRRGGDDWVTVISPCDP